MHALPNAVFTCYRFFHIGFWIYGGALVLFIHSQSYRKKILQIEQGIN